MGELVVKIPDLLNEESLKIEKDIEELISLEEKRKLLSLFIDEVMKGAKQLNNSELIKLGRRFKKGRFEKLKEKGLL
jgi:SpoVK/Ycf46/Vps4 family AAA+-type ATPase